MPLMLTDRKPKFWKCGETGHRYSSCPGKKAPGALSPIDKNRSLVESLKSTSSVMGMSASGTDAVKPPVGSLVRPKVVRLWRKKRGNGWSLSGPDGSARQRDLSPLMSPKGKARIAVFYQPVLRVMPGHNLNEGSSKMI